MGRDKNLILIGMMGAGKTSVGKECAKALSMEFVDTDDIYLARYGSIAKTFDKEGEAVFRQREGEILSELNNAKNKVIACGGGAILTPEFAKLKQSGTVIYLKTDPKTLQSRLESSLSTTSLSTISALHKSTTKQPTISALHKSTTKQPTISALHKSTTRPLYKGIESIEQLLIQRAALYEEYADKTIVTTHLTITQIATQCLADIK